MVYVILANGFEEVEAITPIDILRRAGVEVETAALEGRTAVGAHNIPVTADISIDDIDAEKMDLLMLPGGGGHVLLDKSEKVEKLINYALENNKYIAAICAAPSILGKRGILAGKKATCFPGFEQYLIDAEVVPDKAVVDGKIITGKGAGAASEFGFAITELLKDKATADALKKTMQYE